MLTPEVIVACKTNLAQFQHMSTFCKDGLREVARANSDILMLYPDGKFRPRPKHDNEFSDICIYRLPPDWKERR
jgi:hypothetical protein